MYVLEINDFFVHRRNLLSLARFLFTLSLSTTIKTISDEQRKGACSLPDGNGSRLNATPREAEEEQQQQQQHRFNRTHQDC
jgi:hypothetical protein